MNARQVMTGWGLHPRLKAEVRWAETLEGTRQQVEHHSPLIPYGMGRSYGDTALADTVLRMTRLNHFLSFDDQSGILRCEAGVTLQDILRAFVRRGWFLPVTPGTKYVTLGGAVAADVHGKNHHREGSFCTHVRSLTLLMADGSVCECGPDREVELFETTCGGMGLTGVILEVELQLRPIETAYIRERIVPAANLAEVMDVFASSSGWTYSVAWIDCLARGEKLGRSIVRLGEHAALGELPAARQADPLGVDPVQRLSVPFSFPSWVLNRHTVSLFNSLYYHRYAGKTRDHIVDYDQFFYPLDFVGHWNRIYGKRGLTQYQFVLPLATSREGLTELLQRITASGLGSFLAVLKLFGPEERFISFPREGYTLALDFPIRDDLFPLLDQLDAVVQEHGGRLYLAKDVRMAADTFWNTYPQAQEFQNRLKRYDPGGRFASLQSARLEITS